MPEMFNPYEGLTDDARVKLAYEAPKVIRCSYGDWLTYVVGGMYMITGSYPVA